MKSLIALLEKTPRGRAQVACVPGLEAPCADLVSVFKAATWSVDTQPAASFFSGWRASRDTSELPFEYEASRRKGCARARGRRSRRDHKRRHRGVPVYRIRYFRHVRPTLLTAKRFLCV
jgi:hypothetical protein